MKDRFKIIDNIILIGIYLYIVFMFLTKGEGIRNILILTNFILWLTTMKYRDNLNILIKPVSLLFWCFFMTILVSVVFSIDVFYSFKSLRGDPLKSILLFPVISTVLADEERLKRLAYIFWGLLIFTISVGYYSYWAYNLPLMKPTTAIRHAWHNRFALDLNTLFPFAFMLMLNNKRLIIKIAIAITILSGIVALIFSTSRGGLIAFLSMLCIWAIYINKEKKILLKPVLAGIALILLLLGTTVYFSESSIKGRFLATQKDITTLNGRTIIWSHLVSAAIKRPVFGWGYGSDIFKRDLPFQDTPYKVSPARISSDFRQPHNAFLRVFFHQGILGLLFYIVLLFTAIRIFWKEAFNNLIGVRSYVLMAVASILIGTYLVNAIVENTGLLYYLTLILGIGNAALSINENSPSS